MMKQSVCARRATGLQIGPSRSSSSVHLCAIVCALLCASLWSPLAHGQSIGTEAQEQACRATVVKFEESMAFIRKSVGYEKAAEMKEALLPNKLESELFAKEGYCGVARHLIAKKLVGKDKGKG